MLSAAWRVVICDDQEVYRVGLGTLLDRAQDLQLVGHGGDPEHVSRLAHDEAADVLVMGQSLLGEAAVGLVNTLSARLSVMVLADSHDRHECLNLLRAGARGYLHRSLSAHRLVDGIRAVARGESALDGTAGSFLLEGLSDLGQESEPRIVQDAEHALRQLTPRQLAVTELVAEGLSNAEIAERLVLSRATVKSHLTNVLRRLELRDRTQLAILAKDHGKHWPR